MAADKNTPKDSTNSNTNPADRQSYTTDDRYQPGFVASRDGTAEPDHDLRSRDTFGIGENNKPSQRFAKASSSVDPGKGGIGNVVAAGRVVKNRTVRGF